MQGAIMALQQAIHGSNGKAGSIGAVGKLAYDPQNNRVKGILSGVARRDSDLRQMFALAGEAGQQYPSATRTTFRAFVARGLIEEIRADSSLAYQVEAVLPANGAVQGANLVYFGRNSAKRLPGPQIAEKEAAELESVLQKVEPIAYHDAMARLNNNYSGCLYSLSLLNGSTGDHKIMQLLNLYKETFSAYTFPISEKTIREVASNGNKVLTGLRSDGGIASALIAEKCTLIVEGRPVVLFELSDFATARSDRGNGLITAMQHHIIRLIRSTPETASAIIYAEDRAPWLAVNKSSRQAGMEFAGTLCFHCTIQSDRSVQYEGNYESLNVWHALHQQG